MTLKNPKLGPDDNSSAKNTTDSKFTTGSKFATAIINYSGGHFETTIFKGQLSPKSLQIVKTTAVVKHYGLERRTVFSTEGSSGLGAERHKDRVISGDFLLTVRVKIITGSLVTLENLFSPNYRYRYRLEIRMNFHYRYRLGVRSHPFISIDSQLPS